MEKFKTYASISIMLRTNRPNKIDEYPISVRITKDGKISLMATGYCSLKSHWDKKAQRPNGKHPQYQKLHDYLESTISNLKERAMELAVTNADFSPTELIETHKHYGVKKEAGPASTENADGSNAPNRTPADFYRKLISRMESKSQFATRDTYTAAFKWLFKVKPMEELKFADIDLTFLEDLWAYIVSEKGDIKGNTLFGYFKNYKAFMNKAVKEKWIPKDYTNYKDFSLGNFDTETEPRAISLEEIMKIYSLELPEDSDSAIARDYFVFSFLAGGINFIDMMKLTHAKIADDRVVYRRSKTGEICRFKLNHKTKEIIEKFRGKTYQDFVFPIQSKEYTPLQLYHLSKTEASKVNTELKKIARLCGLQSNLFFYVGRHSTATAMKDLDIPTEAISEAFGHTSLSTTKTYLKRLSSKKQDAYNDKLYLELVSTAETELDTAGGSL